MELGMPVTLVVKAPNQKVADLTVECGLTWTIKKLKQHLSSVYPSNPKEHHQKLIYSGKLLQDHLVLKDVLRQIDENQTTHTVHLVCATPVVPESSQYQQNPAENIRSSTSTSSSSNRSSSSPSVTPPATPSASSQPDGLRYRPQTPQQPQQQAADFFQQQYGGNMGMYYGMPGMAYTPEQMLWMQQMYTQQMAQVMQMYQQGGYPTPPSTPGVTPPVNQPAAANDNVAGAQAGNRPANQQVRMNAGGGAMFDDEEEEEGMNRDWLDWMYTMSRFGILLSIVYFYSTLSRFIMVFTFFVFIYMYQAGWFRLRRRVPGPDRQQEEQPPEQPQPQVAPAGAEAADGEQQQEEGQTAQETGNQNAAPQPEPRLGVFRVSWNFVTTFFSSLIPQQPPAVNAN